MIFLNPAYLWALLGLAVPVAIHLWSRKEGRTIKIGSIELLREKDPKRSSSISPNEFWLLLLRKLAITLLVFILAEPRLTAKTENSPITYLVEPALLSQEDISAILDTLDPEAVRLLQS
ncbi:MAG TPA: BatA domain-containing protein, partial [Gillisia sp.]|nr:BatA domain-containing protein [Gillisia sp.]